MSAALHTFRCSCGAVSAALPLISSRWTSDRLDRWFAEQGWTNAPVRCAACSAKPVTPPIAPEAPAPTLSPEAAAFKAKLDAHPMVRRANARPLVALFDGPDPDEAAYVRRRALRRAA